MLPAAVAAVASGSLGASLLARPCRVLYAVSSLLSDVSFLSEQQIAAHRFEIYPRFIGGPCDYRSRGDRRSGAQSNTSADYLLRRLAPTAPEILNRYESGEFKSARAGSSACGS